MSTTVVLVCAVLALSKQHLPLQCRPAAAALPGAADARGWPDCPLPGTRR